MFYKYIIEPKYHSIGVNAKQNLPHYDNSVKIIQTWSDGGYFCTKNNIFPIKQGHIFLINALDFHYANPLIPNIYNYSEITISADYFKQLCSVFGLTDYAEEHILNSGGCCYAPPTEIIQKVDVFFLNAHQHFRDNDEKLIQTNMVIAIMSILINLYPLEPHIPLKEFGHSAKQLAKYINENSNNLEMLSINNISNALHISNSRVAHLFKELMGKTIIQYKNELQIAQAKKLLLNTDLKIFEISDNLGFHTCTIFNKYFKNIVGCTPRKYRNSCGFPIK